MTQIERPRFQPVARPVDTVGVGTRFIDGAAPAPPARRPAPMAPIQRAAPAPRSSIMDLAEALSGISKAINTVADPYYQAIQDEERSEAEMLALANHVTSWGDMVRRDPSLADRSPFFRSVYEARVARTRVQQFAGSIMGEYYSSGIANSDDPTAITRWLSDRFRPMVDQFQSPGERAAALAEFNQIAQQFTQAHQANARANLVENNRRSFSAGMQTRMDNHMRLGPARPKQMQTSMPALVSGEGGHRLTNPIQAAFLNAVAARESAGHYNIRFDGRSGSFFDDFSRHPNVRVPLPGGNFSTAAGRYQITYSTWNDYAPPGTPFTPENQDMIALAIGYDRYKRLTGRNLWDDLESEGLSYRILDILTPTWAAFGKGSQARAEIIATFQQTLTDLGGRLPKEAAVDGNFQALQADIIQMQEEARVMGTPGDQINNTVLEAVIMKAIEHEDESLLTLAMAPRLDGTPGPGSTVEGRKKIEAARQTIYEMQAANDAARAQAEREAQKALHAKIYDTVAELFLQQLEAGMTPNLSIEDRRAILQEAGEGGAELLDKIHQQLKRNREIADMVDPTIEAQVMAMVYSGAMSPQDVLESYLAGEISNSQLNSLMIEARRSREYGILNTREITGFINRTAEIAANTLLSIPGVNVDARMTATVTEMMGRYVRVLVSDFVKDKGREPEFLEIEEDLVRIRERVLEAVAPDNNEAALQYRERIRNSVEGPREDRPTLLPNSGVNWRTNTIVPTLEIFEAEIEKFNAGEPSVIQVWIDQVIAPEAGGSPARGLRLLREFEERQRALFRAPTARVGGVVATKDDPNRR